MSNIDRLQCKKKWPDGPQIKLEFHITLLGVHHIHLTPSTQPGMHAEIWSESLLDNLNAKIVAWLDQYANGMHPTEFVPYDLHRMTPFTKNVLHAMQAIPFGEICTYKDVANMLNAPKSARPVGGACRRNPIPLLIPCHRVIDSNKGLRGYSAGGLEIKKILLDFEKAVY